MNRLGQEKSLRDLCEHFLVERLYLFGSAVNGEFHLESSDLDFLVTFQPQPPAEYAENYLGLARALEELFQRRVDLVTENSIRNRYFREMVAAQREALYDRRDEKALA
jgi:uncharacterized protein